VSKRSVMVRVVVETNEEDGSLTAAIVQAMAPMQTGRIWTAIDHPDARGARQLWASIELNPGGKGPATGRG
jgi:hypothetical protein